MKFFQVQHGLKFVFLVLPLCISKENAQTPMVTSGVENVIVSETAQDQLDIVPEISTDSLPKEADIEYILKLVEKRKWELKVHKALEKPTKCLYSYQDVALQVCYNLSCLVHPLMNDASDVDFEDEFTEENTTSKHTYSCSRRTLTENTTVGVQIVNTTECLRILNQDSETDAEGVAKPHCAMVLFFSTKCPFSAQIASDFNALGRAFPGVDIMAVDDSQSSGLYTRYGIVAVPDILLFHRGKPVLRYNYTDKSYENLTAFLQNNTGLEVNPDVRVSPEDLEGPLLSICVVGPDYMLWFSNCFVLLFIFHILKQRLGDSIIQRIKEYMDYARQVWRTGEFYEQVGLQDGGDAG